MCTKVRIRKKIKKEALKDKNYQISISDRSPSNFEIVLLPQSFGYS